MVYLRAPLRRAVLRPENPAPERKHSMSILTAISPLLAMFQEYEYEYGYTTLDSTALTIILLFAIPFWIIVIAGIWKVFTKAGEPGWASIVPIYNAIVLLKIAGKPVWWIVLLLIPGVNIVIAFMVMIDLAHNFGKSTGFGVGLTLLGFIFFPILGFGDARYLGHRQQQYGPPGYPGYPGNPGY
jgi:hypothetical protein